MSDLPAKADDQSCVGYNFGSDKLDYRKQGKRRAIEASVTNLMRESAARALS